MKRRHFIRNLGLLSLSQGILGNARGQLNGDLSCCNLHPVLDNAAGEFQTTQLLQSLSLSEFVGEQEENPRLVTNGEGESWLISLRRVPHPEDGEHISCFTLNDGKWREIDQVTHQSGQYEAVTASCGPGGKPVVAWASKEGAEWTIKFCRHTGEGFGVPQTFRAASGKYINPVLLSPEKDRHWLAWECYEKGLFSIKACQFDAGRWSDVMTISEPGKSLFDPAFAESKDGTLFLAHGITDGCHQNIVMERIDPASLSVVETIPVAIGGGLKDRVNMNTKPALAFDREDRLWISWENNRRTHRLEDGDNFTGDRICAAVCYEDGKIMEPSGTGRWLFDGKNDHLPTFIKDASGNLFMATHCGGDFVGNPFWKYRLSWLDPETGWTDPVTIYETSQKGQTSRPALIFDGNGHFWLATNPERWFENKAASDTFGKSMVRVRASKLELHQFRAPRVNTGNVKFAFKPATVREHHPIGGFSPNFSGRPRIERKQVTYRGETYTLLLGNLHEHSEISSCWPAGCDGTIDDDYRFGLYSEGYDFAGLTDHGYALSEVYWRKSLRLAEFYDDPDYFIAPPAIEWTLTNGGDIEIKHGVGHKNVIFPSTEEAMKFVRNRNEILSWRSPETSNSEKLWRYLHQQKIDCVTIPHHPADEVHATDWEVHDPHYETVVEIFQCRGNAEYPGCPRVLNVSRHHPTPNRKAFIDYALRDKHYQMGFIASGDHNGIGVGVAALWVKEVSRQGIVEALKNRRCYATTGDKIFVDFKLNGKWGGESAPIGRKSPSMSYSVEAVQPIKRIDILRDSKVIKTIEPGGKVMRHAGFYVDESGDHRDGTYYYLRIIQVNEHIAWSSPIWLSGSSV